MLVCTQIGNTSANNSGPFEHTNLGFKAHFEFTNKNRSSLNPSLLLACIRYTTLQGLTPAKIETAKKRKRVSAMATLPLLTAVPGDDDVVDMTLVIKCSARSYGFFMIDSVFHGHRTKLTGVPLWLQALQPEYVHLGQILLNSSDFVRNYGGTMRRLYPSKKFYFSQTINRVSSSVSGGGFSNKTSPKYTWIKVAVQSRTGQQSTVEFMQVRVHLSYSCV